MLGLSSILSLFRNAFNKFNNTGAKMLDSIYHITFFYYFKFIFFYVKTSGFWHSIDDKLAKIIKSVSHSDMSKKKYRLWRFLT